VGSVLAVRPVALILAMLLTPLMQSCLITDPIDIPEDVDYPPSIISDNAGQNPIEEVVVLELFDPEVTSLTFDVIVRDPNVEELLEYQIWVDYQGVEGDLSPLLDFGEIPTADGAVDRQFSFPVDNLDLFRSPPNSCHKVELRVSGEFKDSALEFRDPVAEGDYDSAVWFIDARTDDGARPTLEQCP
jgi:hypothetical protein